MPYYAADFTHWSDSGHRLAAQNMRKIVKAEKIKVSNRVGSWGECSIMHVQQISIHINIVLSGAGDKCMNWLTRGKLVGNIPTNGVMEQFDFSLKGVTFAS